MNCIDHIYERDEGILPAPGLRFVLKNNGRESDAHSKRLEKSIFARILHAIIPKRGVLKDILVVTGAVLLLLSWIACFNSPDFVNISSAGSPGGIDIAFLNGVDESGLYPILGGVY